MYSTKAFNSNFNKITYVVVEVTINNSFDFNNLDRNFMVILIIFILTFYTSAVVFP